MTETPTTGRHAREPAPTTAQIVLPGHRPTALPHPVESPGGLAEDQEWYRTAVFYEVMLRTFADSSGQGSGDLRGLIDRLDYLQWLGIAPGRTVVAHDVLSDEAYEWSSPAFVRLDPAIRVAHVIRLVTP